MNFFKNLYIWLMPFVLLLLILTACNDDLFIDRDSMAVKSDKTELDFKGDKSTVIFKDISEGDIPNINISAISLNNEIVEILRGEKIKESMVIDNGMFKMNVGFDKHSGKINLNLAYSFYSDTVYINLGRMIYDTWNDETLKVLPATGSELKSLDYDNSGYFILGDLGYKYETFTYDYVNSSDTPQTYTPVGRNLMQLKGGFVPYDRTGIYDLLGSQPPLVNAVVTRGEFNVKTESKIPFSTGISLIPDEYFTVDDPITTTVPPRSLCQVKIRVKIEDRGIPYSMMVENKEIDGVSVYTSGLFDLKMPVDYTVKVNCYSLETGEEVYI